MLAAEAVSRARPRRSARSTRATALLIGFAQALALVPGVSRSGATISAGLFLGFDRAAAARYSFLLSVPAVVLSGLFELRHVGGEGGAAGRRDGRSRRCSRSSSATPSIAFLLRYLARHTIAVFVAYRVCSASW